jgi:glutaredoxin
MLLVSKNLSYQELKLNEDFTRASLLSLYPSVKTYPVIIIDGFNIGGYEELNKYLLNEETTNNNLKFLAEGA